MSERRTAGDVLGCVLAIGMPMLFAGVVAGSVLVWLMRGGPPPPCEVVVERGGVVLDEERADPAGPWVARLRREACGDGWFVTVVFTVVEVAAPRGAPWAEVARVAETDLDDVTAQWPEPAVLALRVDRRRHVELKPYAAPDVAIRVTIAPR
jgi:hypothetical protein